MDDNKKFGDVSQEDIDKAKKAAPDDLKEKQPVNVMDEVFEWAESFVFAMFVVILIFTFFFRIVLVQGPSMRETLQDQDRLIITHINYTTQKGRYRCYQQRKARQNYHQACYRHRWR